MALTRRILVVTLLGVAASLAADFLLLDRDNLHAILPYADTPGFWAAFGLFWCGLLVLGSKWLGRAFLTRERDPYINQPPPASQHPPDADDEAVGR